ncbi:uncharacterized protein LOC112170878 [Rosa chinensis]|uniref:uncharacterized protein LOC112170878 n=1 Tax=Rosa chinensis TaxID=74649 RepID=UPI000D087B20|nr:uncharacterized protein LOC112170878 [Rosa chinensis]
MTGVRRRTDLESFTAGDRRSSPENSGLGINFETKTVVRAPKTGASAASTNPNPLLTAHTPALAAVLHGGPSPKTPKPSYAATLSAVSPIPFAIADLPLPFLEDGLISVRISEKPFLRGLERCKTNLIGRVNSPIKTPDLVHQLKQLWKGLDLWTVAPLGRGFFMIQFKNLVDMQRVWSLETVRLNSDMLRLIKWSPEFSPSTYKNTFAQVWVPFWDLGFAYWDQQTLFEIASGLSTPLKLDPRTKNSTVGLFAKVLVDIDFSQSLHDKLRITRANGEVVVIGVKYESEPDICSRCGMVGHVAGSCRSAAAEDIVAAVSKERGRSVERSELKRRRKNQSRKSQRHSQKHGVILRMVREPDDVTASLELTVTNLRNEVGDMRASSVLNDVETLTTAPFLTEAPVIMAAPVMDGLMEVAVPAQKSDSSDSVPPGFTRLEPENELQASSSTSTPVVSAAPPSIIVADCNQSDCQLGDRTEALEDEEFTPVLSKKSKKLQKQNEKTKNKIISHKPAGRALLRKGASLKCF